MLDRRTLRTPQMTRRTFITALGKVGFLGLLFSRLFYMQFIKQDKYKTLSEQNRISLIIKPPIRGDIYDVNNQLVASNRQCFRLLLDKSSNPNYIEEILLLKKILNLGEEEVKTIIKKIKQSAVNVPVMIIDQLEWKEIAVVEENKLNLSSVYVSKCDYRFYPLGGYFAHIIGYLGKEERNSAGNLLINKQEFDVGKTGVEKYYENLIQGEIGYKQMEVNAYGKYLRTLNEYEGAIGNNFHLTLDSDIQTNSFGYLNKQGASVVIMDVNTGEIRIMASAPGFDPNKFFKLTPEYWKSLNSNPYKPLINKVISSTYPPGSVFKVVTILAALESGMPANQTVRCIGGVSALGTTHFKCASSRGHGAVNMYNAVKFSCNAYMYAMAKKAGADTILSIAKKLGFGVSSGIDLPSESAGFVPPNKEWKKTRFKSDWGIADTMNISIGQGFISATPLQIVRAMAAIASGKLITPHVSKSHPNIIVEDLDIPAKHLEILREAMNRAVNSPGGTGFSSRNPDPSKQMAGKTGTSQVFSKGGKNSNRHMGAWQNRHHAVFGGFAPFNNPKYAVAVLVDHGGYGGKAAAPVATAIMSSILDKYS